jgi:ABC-type oligopeptide transport system substrate-binding subunit
VRLLQFNTRRGPFVDRRLRRAVSYALDRRALAAAQGEPPGDSYLPSAFAAAPRAHAYPLSPDLGRARALARGFHGTIVLYVCNRPECDAVSRIVKANLAPLGISVQVQQFEDQFSAAAEPGATYDLVLYSWFFDYPDPYGLLNVFLDPNSARASWVPPALPIPAAYRRRLERAALLRGDARAAAYRQLTLKLERNVAPFAAYATPVLPELFSPRLGCRVEQPIIGSVNIGTLCINRAA